MASPTRAGALRHDLTVRTLPVSELRPWADNPRDNDAAAERLAHTILTHGWTNPILLDKTGQIVAGHTRLKAALKLGLTEVPTITLDAEGSEAIAIAIADNRLAEFAEWDDPALTKLLQGLADDDFDLDALGYDADEFAELMDSLEPEGPTGPDDGEVTEPPEEPGSKPGEVYELGPHRLVCGDSLDAAVLDALLVGRRVGLTFTDPPYGVSFQSGMSEGGTATRFDKLANDDRILPVAPVVWARMGDDSAAFIWTSHHVYPAWRAQFADFYKGTVIWSKGGGGIGDLTGSYATDYEMALFCVKGRVQLRTPRSGAVWSIGKDGANSYLHPTQKPVALAAKAVMDFSDMGDVVLDLFGGSGSTLIACARLGRVAALVELDPGYCDVIRRRWTTWADEAGVDAGSGALRDE